jgi:hypothetical protein
MATTTPTLGKERADKCNYCEATTGLHTHHILPKSLGGTDDGHNLLTVCKEHHWMLHGVHERASFSELTKRGIAKAKEKGVMFGNRTNLKEAQTKGGAATKAKYAAFAQRVRPMLNRLREAGMTFRAIAEEFNVMGVPTARNGSWDASTVHSLITRTA